MTELTRRLFFAAMAASVGTIAARKVVASEAKIEFAPRPKPPYRVWFQPRLFVRDVDLYANMTIDASGWIDPRIAHRFGKTTLDWVYGLNHPYADGPGYWRDVCLPTNRSRPASDPRFRSAGIAVDEWVPPAKPQNVEWLVEGLRAGRRADPDVFIAVWSTDPTPPLLDLTKEGTVDLVLIEGYTHSVEPGLTTSWENALRRYDAFAEAGCSERTVCCFGHITPKADSRGGKLKASWLHDRAEELKRRYPQMPGIAFFQSTDDDSPELRDLIHFCDQMSVELWPT